MKQEITNKVFALSGAASKVLAGCTPGQTVKVVCTGVTPFDIGDGVDREKREYEGFTCDVDL